MVYSQYKPGTGKKTLNNGQLRDFTPPGNYITEQTLANEGKFTGTPTAGKLVQVSNEQMQSEKAAVLADTLRQQQGRQRVMEEQQNKLQITENEAIAKEAFVKPTISEQDILNAVPQENALDNVGVGGAAIGGAISGAGVGAGVGAAVGSVVPIVGTAAGALVGGVAFGIAGAIGGAWTKISVDKRGDVKQAKKVASIANVNFGQTIDALNAGLITRQEALDRWNSDKISLYAAQANLKRDTAKDLDRFLSSGSDEMADVDGYVRDLEQIYQTEFALALLQPNPANIKYRYAQQPIEE